jgi:hypothetical protein
MKSLISDRKIWGKHLLGSPINPDSLARFNQAKNLKVTKNFTLVREFFKHLGQFTNEDSKVFVLRLLGKNHDQ